VRTTFDQSATEEVAAQQARVMDPLEARHSDAAAPPHRARDDPPVLTAFPGGAGGALRAAP